MKTIRCIRRDIDVMVPVNGGTRVKFSGDRLTLPDEVVDTLLGYSVPGFFEILHSCTDEILRDGAPILVIRDVGLGDVLLTTPLIREMATRGGAVDVATCDRYRSVMKGNPYVRKTFALELGEPDTSPYVATLDLRGFAERLDFNKIHLHRAKAFGSAADLDVEARIDYFVTDQERKWATGEVQNRGPRGPLVGYVWRPSHDTRAWSDAQHARMLKALIGHGYDVAVFDERHVSVDVDGAWNFSGRLGIRQVAAMIDQCAAIVTPDTGLFHVACALRRPIVAYFSTFPVDLRATHSDVTLLGRRENCALWPCKIYTCLNRFEDRMPRCLETDEAQLLDAVRGAVDRGQQS